MPRILSCSSLKLVRVCPSSSKVLALMSSNDAVRTRLLHEKAKGSVCIIGQKSMPHLFPFFLVSASKQSSQVNVPYILDTANTYIVVLVGTDLESKPVSVAARPKHLNSLWGTSGNFPPIKYYRLHH